MSIFVVRLTGRKTQFYNNEKLTNLNIFIVELEFSVLIFLTRHEQRH